MAVSGGLVVVIDAKDGSKPALDALDAHLAKIRASSSETSGTLSSLTQIGASLGITLGLRAAISQFTQATTAALAFGETLEKASAKTGLSVATLSTLHYAATVTNSDFDGVTTAVARMDKTIGAAADGNEKAAGVIKSLGLNAKDLAGRSDGAEVALRALGATLANTSSAARRNELATALTGRGGVDQVALLQRLGTNFDEFRRKAQDAGVQLGDDTAARLARANEQLRDMQERARGAALGFTDGLIPAISALASIISGGKGDFDDFSAFGRKFGQGLAYATAGVYGLLGGIETLRAKGNDVSAYLAEKSGSGDTAAKIRKLGEEQRASADAFYKKGDAADMVFQTGFAPGAGESISEHRRLAGRGGSGRGYTGTPDAAGASKVAEAQRGLDDARRKAAEQSARTEADRQKSHAGLMLELLEGDYKRRLVSEDAYYARKHQLEQASLYADQAADVRSYGALAIEKTRVAAHPGASEADHIKTRTKLVELSTEQAKIADRILERSEKIAAADAKAGTATALRKEALQAQSDQLAAQLEETRGGTAARLKQLDDETKILAAVLGGQYGPGSQEVRNYQAGQAQKRGGIVLSGAEQQYDVANAKGDAQLRMLDYQERAGQLGSGDARARRAAIGQQQADNLQPVLEAYKQLAAGGDLQAAAKVEELSEKIIELRNPIDEVSAHLRESFDGAFEDLFLNFDQGAAKAFEGFGKNLERALQKAIYERTVQPMTEKLVGNITAGLGFPSQQSSNAGMPTTPGNTTGGAKGIFESLFQPFIGSTTLPGKGDGKKVTIELNITQDAASGAFTLDSMNKDGDDDDTFEAKMANNFGKGGFLYQLFGGKS